MALAEPGSGGEPCSRPGKRQRVFSAEEAVAELPVARWIVECGGTVDGVRVEDAGASGRRLVATRDLPADFTFARVPDRCVLSCDACANMTHGRLMQRRFRLVVPEELREEDVLGVQGHDGELTPLPMVTRRAALYTALMLAPAATGDGGPLGLLLKQLWNGGAPPTPFSWDVGARDCPPRDAWAEVPGPIAEVAHWMPKPDDEVGEELPASKML